MGGIVYLKHHILWKEGRVSTAILPLTGFVKRLLAGMPLVITTAIGLRRVAIQSSTWRWEHTPFPVSDTLLGSQVIDW